MTFTKRKEGKKSIKEKYIGQQVLRAVIADILGIANIADIADVADIVTDIADIADVVNIQILWWKQVDMYEVLPKCLNSV